MDTLSSLLEFAMLFTFGLSWPFAIARTYRAKRVDGKSPQFEILVIIGYLCGITAKVIAHKQLWLIGVYVVDTLLVSTDLTLYFYYSIKNRRGDYDFQNLMRELRKCVLADGKVDLAETKMLREVVALCGQRNTPAASHLADLLQKVLADGRVTEDESRAIAAAISAL